MTETGPHFTTWRPLQHEPFRDPEAIWYPAVQVDRFVAAQEEEIAKLQEQVRFGRERIDFHLNRAERAEKEIVGLQKQLEPLDLYRKVLPIVLQKRDAARKELAETLHALHHHDDCNAVKAARKDVEILRGAYVQFLRFVRSDLHTKAVLRENALEHLIEMGFEKPEARRAIEKGGIP